MEALAVLGAISASGTIIAGITRTVQALSDVRERFHGADITIGLLISELTTVKAAVIQIEDWAKFNFRNGPVQVDLGSAFQDSLEGCKIAMQVLAEEVQKVLDGMSPEGPGFIFRMRHVWNESAMREHQQRLHTQVGALQLLIQVVQIRTLPGQAALLREPKNRKILEKVRDDTSSLRTRVRLSQAGSEVAPSRTMSTIGSTVFGVDRAILDTAVYRRNGAHVQEKREGQETRGDGASNSGEDRLSNAPPREYRSRTQMVGSPGSPASGDQPPPIMVRLYSEWEKPLPYEKSIVSDPSWKIKSRGRLAFHASSASDSGLRGSGKPSEAKSSVWAAIKQHGSLWPLTGQKHLSPPSPGSQSLASRRGRRRAENDFHRSIDFTSQDGLTVPPIVRAAQSGSCREIEELLDQGANIEDTHATSGRTALAVAAHCGNEDIVQLLLQYGARVDVVDASSWTPLHLAASRGHYRVVEYLLQEHVDVDAVCLEKKTPLRLASDNGYDEVAALLLRKRAKVNARDWQQLTAVHAAAKLGDEAMVNLLVTHGADIEAKDGSFMAAIHYAAEGGYDAIVDVLLNKKANIECLGKASMTPLACASSSGSTEVAKLLIRRKASLRHRCEGDMTPLHWASYNGHAEVVELLLQKRVTIDARTSDGRSPLHLAVMSRNFSTAELLVRRKAAVAARCIKNYQPLHYACEIADLDLVQLLLGYSADIEAQNQLGLRPLHIATAMEAQPIVELLLAKGASIEARDAAGDRPLCSACVNGHLKLVQYFLDQGSPMRLKFSTGPSHEDSPLCLAAKYGHVSVVLELIGRGASIRQRDEQNWQPLRYAAHFGHESVVELLLHSGASISGLGPSGGWGFDMTASRIGFAADVDEARRARILSQLHQAETREQLMQEDNSHQGPLWVSPQQDGPAEKADDEDGYAMVPETPPLQERPPPADPLFPYPPPPPETPTTDASIDAIASTISSAPPVGYSYLGPPYHSTDTSQAYYSQPSTEQPYYSQLIARYISPYAPTPPEDSALPYQPSPAYPAPPISQPPHLEELP